MQYALCASTGYAGTRSMPASDIFRETLVDLLPSLKAFAQALTRNRTVAEDLVQDASESALSHASSFIVGTNMRAWLFTILRNRYYSQRRREWRNVQDVDGEHTARLTTEPAQNVALDVEDARRALSMLTKQQRDLLLSVGLSGDAYSDLALARGCAVGTIKSRVNRARRRLKEFAGALA